MTTIRVLLFVVFALLVGFVGRMRRRLRVRRVSRWRLASSWQPAVMVGHCTTLPEVHTSYLALDAPCPFCGTVRRPSYRRTQLGPVLVDWYDTPPATEALPPDDDDEGGSSGPFLVAR